VKKEYRITKYDPKYRNPDGTYGKNEWTAISDIGKVFGKVLLTKKEYQEIENQYCDAVASIMEENKIPYLEIRGLERGAKQGLRNGQRINEKEVKRIVRGALRETFWCKLHLDRRMFVHFGYDYYMYVGVSKEPAKSIQAINRGRLYVEPKQSPYAHPLPKYLWLKRLKAAQRKSRSQKRLDSLQKVRDGNLRLMINQI
jgi:hypothetical protein